LFSRIEDFEKMLKSEEIIWEKKSEEMIFEFFDGVL
jgi:hypothetical protein